MCICFKINFVTFCSTIDILLAATYFKHLIIILGFLSASLSSNTLSLSINMSKNSTFWGYLKQMSLSNSI